MAKAVEGRVKIEFPLVVAALNRRAHRRRMRKGELSLATGIDGRYVGGLRKFAGFNRLRQLEDDTFYDFRYISIQKGSTAYALRGFLALHDAVTPTLTFYYYDEGTSSWGSQDLTSLTLTATTKFAVTTSGIFAYICAEGNAPVVLYYDSSGAAFVQKDMGPGAAYIAAGGDGLLATSSSSEGAADSGYLDSGGTYGFAYRYYDSTRGIYSSISDTETVTPTNDQCKYTLSNPDTDADRAYDQGYDTLQILRTLSATVVDSSFESGLFFVESEYTLDDGADCWPATVEVGIQNDKWLKYVDVYDPRRDVSGLPPNSHAILYYEGTNFIGGEAASGSLITQLQWSQLHRNNAEVFPLSGHSMKWENTDGLVQRFVRAGDTIYAFTDNATFQIAKAGAQLRIMRLHGNRGITSYRAADEVGRDLMCLTDLGMTVIDGANGAVKTNGAFDRVFFEDWADSLDDVFVVTDGRAGVSFFCNPTEEQACLMWHVTGAATMLDDMHFVGGCSGPDPESGGASQAWFLTSSGVVVTFDRTADGTGTMIGVDASADNNGTATGGSTTTVVDSAATFHASQEGGYLYVFDDDGSYEARLITGVNPGANTLTVTSVFSESTDGKRYSVSPVVFRVRTWGLPPSGAPEEFGRRICNNMSLHLAELSGVTANPNAVARFGVCAGFEDAPSAAMASATLSETPDDMYKWVNRASVFLEPWVEIISASVFFELLAVSVDGIITETRKTV